MSRTDNRWTVREEVEAREREKKTKQEQATNAQTRDIVDDMQME